MKKEYRKSRYTRNIVIGAQLWLVLVVLVSSFGPMLVSADIVWSDNFDDGNYDGWTICDNSTLHGGDYGWNGSKWSADNYYLQLEEDFGIISHPSNVAYGTWSFDFKSNTTQTGNIAFISNNFYDLDNLYIDGQFYFINFDVFTYEEPHNFTISLCKRFDNAKTILDSHSKVPVAGWHHFDVTRTTDGLFSVYLNGSPTPIMQVVDTDIDTSEMCWLWMSKWQTLDNIVVDDEIPTTSTTTTSTTSTDGGFDMTMILLVGGGIAAIVVIVLVVWKFRGRT